MAVIIQDSDERELPIFIPRHFKQRTENIRNVIKSTLNLTSFLESVFFANLIDLPKVADFKAIKNGEITHFFVFTHEPDIETEEKIYDIYAEVLDYLPKNIDFQVIELFGQKPDDLISYLLE